MGDNTLCFAPFPFVFRNNTQDAVWIIQPYCYFGTHALSLLLCVYVHVCVCACMCVFMCVYVCSCLCVTVLLEVKEQPFCCSTDSVYLDFETVSMTGHPLISNNHLIPAPWRWDQKYARQCLGFLLTMVANWNSNYEHMNTLISLKTCRYCCVTEFVFSQMIPGAESWQQWVLVRPSAVPCACFLSGHFLLSITDNRSESHRSITFTLDFMLLFPLLTQRPRLASSSPSSSAGDRHAQWQLDHSCLCWWPMLVHHQVCATISK